MVFAAIVAGSASAALEVYSSASVAGAVACWSVALVYGPLRVADECSIEPPRCMGRGLQTLMSMVRELEWCIIDERIIYSDRS